MPIIILLKVRLCLTCLINRKFWSSWQRLWRIQSVKGLITSLTESRGLIGFPSLTLDTAECPSWAGPHLQAQCLWNCFWNTSWNLKEVSSESTPQKTYLSLITGLDQLPSSKITLNLLLIASSLCGPQSM